MAPTNAYTPTPHQNHRQNRRRERPGSRTRRTITRKASIQQDCYEGLLDAHDLSIPLPSDKTRSSPLLRQNFDQSWQRWKTRQAEEKAALIEMDILQMEQEQRRLFGGEADDDELYRMGILYNEDDSAVSRDENANVVSCDVAVEHSFPCTFVLSHGKPKRSRRSVALRSTLPPLYLSLSDLSDDSEIARLLARSIASVPVALHASQHRERPVTKPHPLSITTDIKTDLDIPQSLPPPSAFESMYGSGSLSIPASKPNDPPQISLPPHAIDWTFISSPSHTDTTPSSPSSEPDTWVLIDDS